MNRLHCLLLRLLLTTDQQALLHSLRRLSQTDQQFIRRAVEALAQHPTN